MKNVVKILAVLFSSHVLISCAKNEATEVEATSADISTYARFVPERKDDFAFENDLIAFRMYGPAARSGSENAGLDCWLKRVDYPIIDKWYKQALEQDKSYHTDWGEGLDNYHVGSSAGCGSSALWLNGAREPLEAFVRYEIISVDTQKSEFKLFYEKEVAGDVYTEERHIEIELGKRLFKTTSSYLKNGEIASDLPVAIGLSTHDEKADVYWQKDMGYVATWEVIDDYGLGTAVMLAPDLITEYKQVFSNGEKDLGHALLIANTDENGQITYYAGYGWEKAQKITSIEQWMAYLNNF